MQRLLDRLTYSNVVSSICLVLVLGGGTAFAATKLGKNSVGTKQLKSGSVTGAKIAAGAVNGEKVEANSLTGADIKTSSLGTVPTADLARTATSANSAQTAVTAKTAESADTAKTAESAKTAQTAATAERANIATSANSAATAGSAISAQTAGSAQTAKSAESAAKATVAETLSGHTPFSYFTFGGERQVAQIAPFTISLNCSNENGEETATMTVASEEGESTLAVVGKAAQTLGASTPVAVLTAKGPEATKTVKDGQDFTLISPSGTAIAVSTPTVGFSLDQFNHPGQCYFSGVLERLPALQ